MVKGSGEGTVLFVCDANIGRSQIAEAAFNELRGKHPSSTFMAESAGIGERAVSLKGKAITDFGDLIRDYQEKTGAEIPSSQTVKPLSKEMFDGADRVIIMTDKRENLPDYARDSSKTEFWDVKDPHNVTSEERKEIISKIREMVGTLFDGLTKKTLAVSRAAEN